MVLVSGQEQAALFLRQSCIWLSITICNRADLRCKSAKRVSYARNMTQSLMLLVHGR